MIKPRFTLLLIVLLLAPAVSGCVISREMTQIKRDVERRNPDLQLSRNLVLSLGGGSIHMAESVLGLLENDQALLAASLLHDIDQIRIGIYDATWKADHSDVDLDNLSRFRDNSWERALVVRDQGTIAHVLYRPHRRSIRDLYLVTFHDQQLVAIRFRGNVERILMRALEQRSEHKIYSVASLRGILEP